MHAYAMYIYDETCILEIPFIDLVAGLLGIITWGGLQAVPACNTYEWAKQCMCI
jgi:hypothetical protein